MTKHTPGPWEIDTHHGMQIGPARLRMPDDRTAARTARLWADAHLIAAAPELLEALTGAHMLISMMAHGDKFPPDKLGMALKLTRAAIAKATGGSP